MNKEFLLKYLNTDSPSTLEIEGQKVWLKELKPYADKVITDNYGNVALLIKGTKSKYPFRSKNPFKVVIDAHADEIGWVVKSITDDGFLKVQRNGGTDNDITMGTSVKILTKKGKVKGFFGSPAIHLKDKDTKKVEQESLAIDVAAFTKEDVEKLGIEVGSFVVVDRVTEIINEKFVVGKSLDDKVGGFIHSEVLKKLKEDKIKLPYDLYIVNSVQEEVGLRGARMMNNLIKPDVAIAFDVTFDTNTPGINKDKHGDFKMGEGIVLRQGFDVHNTFLKLLKDCAKENDINYKIQVGGSGGTNTFSYYQSGAVAATLSIPLRYMHTQNEMVMLDDVQTAVDFYVKALQKIENNHNFRYL
jgi:putative aminopeptidase FrvX